MQAIADRRLRKRVPQQRSHDQPEEQHSGEDLTDGWGDVYDELEPPHASGSPYHPVGVKRDKGKEKVPEEGQPQRKRRRTAFGVGTAPRGVVFADENSKLFFGLPTEIQIPILIRSFVPIPGDFYMSFGRVDGSDIIDKPDVAYVDPEALRSARYRSFRLGLPSAEEGRAVPQRIDMQPGAGGAPIRFAMLPKYWATPGQLVRTFLWMRRVWDLSQIKAFGAGTGYTNPMDTIPFREGIWRAWLDGPGASNRAGERSPCREAAIPFDPRVEAERRQRILGAIKMRGYQSFDDEMAMTEWFTKGFMGSVVLHWAMHVSAHNVMALSSIFQENMQLDSPRGIPLMIASIKNMVMGRKPVPPVSRDRAEKKHAPNRIRLRKGAVFGPQFLESILTLNFENERFFHNTEDDPLRSLVAAVRKSGRAPRRIPFVLRIPSLAFNYILGGIMGFFTNRYNRVEPPKKGFFPAAPPSGVQVILSGLADSGSAYPDRPPVIGLALPDPASESMSSNLEIRHGNTSLVAMADIRIDTPAAWLRWIQHVGSRRRVAPTNHETVYFNEGISVRTGVMMGGDRIVEIEPRLSRSALPYMGSMTEPVRIVQEGKQLVLARCYLPPADSVSFEPQEGVRVYDADRGVWVVNMNRDPWWFVEMQITRCPNLSLPQDLPIGAVAILRFATAIYRVYDATTSQWRIDQERVNRHGRFRQIGPTNIPYSILSLSDVTLGPSFFANADKWQLNYNSPFGSDPLIAGSVNSVANLGLVLGRLFAMNRIWFEEGGLTPRQMIEDLSKVHTTHTRFHFNIVHLSGVPNPEQNERLATIAEERDEFKWWATEASIPMGFERVALRFLGIPAFSDSMHANERGRAAWNLSNNNIKSNGLWSIIVGYHMRGAINLAGNPVAKGLQRLANKLLASKEWMFASPALPEQFERKPWEKDRVAMRILPAEQRAMRVSSNIIPLAWAIAFDVRYQADAVRRGVQGRTPWWVAILNHILYARIPTLAPPLIRGRPPPKIRVNVHDQETWPHGTVLPDSNGDPYGPHFNRTVLESADPLRALPYGSDWGSKDTRLPADPVRPPITVTVLD